MSWNSFPPLQWDIHGTLQFELPRVLRQLCNGIYWEGVLSVMAQLMQRYGCQGLAYLYLQIDPITQFQPIPLKSTLFKPMLDSFSNLSDDWKFWECLLGSQNWERMRKLARIVLQPIYLCNNFWPNIVGVTPVPSGFHVKEGLAGVRLACLCSTFDFCSLVSISALASKLKLGQ